MSHVFPIYLSKEECKTKIVHTHLKNIKFIAKFQFVFRVDSINKSFVFSTDNEVTAKLINKIWNITPASELIEEPQLIVAYQEGYHGRYIDCSHHRQLVSNSYTPFTIVKQGLRWQYACTCFGTSMLPLHGVVIKLYGKYICFSGYGKAGKSYIADLILQEYRESTIVVDDWSLIDIKTKSIYRVGDTYLHARGSALDKKSFQLNGGAAELVELCANDICSEETRFLIKRSELTSFYHDGEELRLDAIVFIRDPFSDKVLISTDVNEINTIIESESRHFWDDSNLGLPDQVLEEMSEKWHYLTLSLKSFILDGHRRANLSFIIKRLVELME